MEWITMDNHFLVDEKTYFYCPICPFINANKKDYKRHFLTKKHIKNSDNLKLTKKQKITYSCKYCDDIQSDIQGYFLHKRKCRNSKKTPSKKSLSSATLSVRNETKTNMSWGKTDYPLLSTDKKTPKKNPRGKYVCICGKEYKYQSGLCKHRNKCEAHIGKREDLAISSENLVETKNDENSEFMKLMKDFMKTQIETNKQISQLVQTPQNVYYNDNKKIINNNKMMINVYLNDKCKGAISLKDFINNLNVSLEDIHYSKKNGYAKGITNILVKQLESLEPIERPIFCSDMQRLQFYIKNDDKWEQDINNKNIDKSIKSVKYKQVKALKEWEQLNPNFLEDSKLLDEWNKLIYNIMEDDMTNNEANSRTILENLSKVNNNDILMIHDNSNNEI